MARRARQRRLARSARGLRVLAAASLLAVLAGCTTQVRHHGYAPDDQTLAQLQVGRDTRDTVAAAIGRPGTAGVLTDGGWYYVGSRWESRGIRLPVEVEREVVALSFDQGGRLSNVERFGLEQGQMVPLSRRVTEGSMPEQSLIDQLLRNIGRFAPGDGAATGPDV
jgi:outer membrane protein assembly factor BamE (lipoprotein component of BamABCDE complex)